jgi:hypothetical protein
MFFFGVVCAFICFNSLLVLNYFNLANNPIQPQKVKWTSNGHNLVLSDKSNATVIEVYEGLADRLLSN